MEFNASALTARATIDMLSPLFLLAASPAGDDGRRAGAAVPGRAINTEEHWA